MISKKFIQNSVIYTLAGMLPMASAVILLPFYLRYLPLEQYGQLAFYLAFSMFVRIVATYSFDSSLYIYYHDYKKQPAVLATLVSSAFVFMIALGAVIVIVFTLLGEWAFSLIPGESQLSYFPYGFLSVLGAVFQAFFKVQSSLLQTQEKPVTFLWANLISFSLIALFTIGGLVLYPEQLVGPVGGRAAASVLSGAWALERMFRRFGFHFDFPLLKTTFKINNSNFIYQVQQWFINYFDRILITIYLTMQDVGAYDFVWKCMLVIDLLIGALYNSFYPKVIAEISEQSTKGSSSTINRYYHGLTSATMLLVTGAIFALPFVERFSLIKPEYVGALEYVPYLGLVYLIRAMRFYFVLPYGAIKYTKPLPLIYLLISAVKIGLMIVSIRHYGVMAVIGASFVSAVIEVILLYATIRNKFIFRFNILKIVIAPLVLALVIIVLEGRTPLHADLVHAFYVVFALLLLFWFYRHEISALRSKKT